MVIDNFCRLPFNEKDMKRENYPKFSNVNVHDFSCINAWFDPTMHSATL